ncbi:MAG: radical SAM protein [Flavobacteriia bacterium]|nr:radical SAM protein [Flavobacteriia bacterium]
MKQKVFFITPPFTQLNTPYPATAYLKGFLNTHQVPVYQTDLGIEVILKLFSKEGLIHLFNSIDNTKILSENSRRIVRLKSEYIKAIDPVISFLHDKNPTLAHLICERNYLPEASRFNHLEDLEWAFGTMGIRDKARHFATLFLEDISDLIIEAIDPHFGFSRYAERLGRSALSFDGMYKALQLTDTYIDSILLSLLKEKLEQEQPTLVAISVPFPGNLYAAFKCGQYIKKHYPTIKVTMGGGYANTELRSVKDQHVFEFVDFITLDDGERALLNLLEYLEGNRSEELLKRTFKLSNNEVVYINGSKDPDFKQKDVGTPDYSDLPLDKYLSVIEIANPMHRLWSDGRWNKLTLAHGCYWGKCTFCDISLDYIKTYEAATATILVDRIEQLIQQTGNNGFHFVDEAAPPALMREVALEIIRRELTVVWWTNIRFEKSFSFDLCRLLAQSGCIAVSGGLEVASDRLLRLIEKGVTVAQVAKVADNFTQSGIMVHAYLMYGFPTQTAQETIDSLEVVRQLFELGVLQSGFWHQFAMTAHSPVGLNPEKYNVIRNTPLDGTFANNDLYHDDPTGCEHELFSEGLKKSLFNYMHGIGFELPLQQWFDFKIPKTIIPKTYIERSIDVSDDKEIKPSSKLIWLGGEIQKRLYSKNKKGKTQAMVELSIASKKEDVFINVKEEIGHWLFDELNEMHVKNKKFRTFELFKSSYELANIGDFEIFWSSFTFAQLRDNGLYVI